MSSGKLLVVVGFILSGAAACSRISDAPPGAELSLLRGHCIELLQPADVLRLAGPKVIEGSLYVPASPANERKIATMPAGSKIVIERVVVLRSFGARHSILIGHIDGLGLRVSLFMLFDGDWLRRSELDAFENRQSAALRPGALRGDVARWCPP